MNDTLSNNLQFESYMEPVQVTFSFAAPGWQLLFSFAGLVVLLFIIYGFIRYRKNRYKREALHSLKMETNRLFPLQKYDELIYSACMLTKQVAMHQYKRIDIASIESNDWVLFLNHSCKKNLFSNDDAVLISSVYENRSGTSPENVVNFINRIKYWIKNYKYVTPYSQ